MPDQTATRESLLANRRRRTHRRASRRSWVPKTSRSTRSACRRVSTPSAAAADADTRIRTISSLFDLDERALPNRRRDDDRTGARRRAECSLRAGRGERRPHPEVVKPDSLAGYFEVMTRAAFQAGVSWRQIADHWQAYREAFASFDPVQVAAYDDVDIDRVLATPGILRMPRKVRATIANAAMLLRPTANTTSFQRICARSTPTRGLPRISRNASRSWAT